MIEGIQIALAYAGYFCLYYGDTLVLGFTALGLVMLLYFYLMYKFVLGGKRK